VLASLGTHDSGSFPNTTWRLAEPASERMQAMAQLATHGSIPHREALPKYGGNPPISTPIAGSCPAIGRDDALGLMPAGCLYVLSARKGTCDARALTRPGWCISALRDPMCGRSSLGNSRINQGEADGPSAQRDFLHALVSVPQPPDRMPIEFCGRLPVFGGRTVHSWK